jgi:hypothetical protein
MHNVLDDIRPDLRPKMWQKCERLSWKFMMFATLLGCCMECANKLNMQHIAAQFVLRLLGNDQTEYCIAVCTELKEQAEYDHNLSPASLLVTNRGCLGTTMRRSRSHLSGRLQLHRD